MRTATALGLTLTVLVLAGRIARAAESAVPTVLKATGAPEGTALAWTRLGPGGGGWIQSIAWDPHDPETLYVGCDVGGF